MSRRHPGKNRTATDVATPANPLDIDSSVLRIPIINRAQKRSPTNVIADLQANWVASTVRLREIIEHGFPRATVYKLLAHGCANADVVTLVHVGAILGYRLHWVPMHPEDQKRVVSTYDRARAYKDERITKRLQRAHKEVMLEVSKPGGRR